MLRAQKVPSRFFGENEEECLLTPASIVRFRRFLKFFIPVYLIVMLISYYIIGIVLNIDPFYNRDLYVSITFFTTLFSIYSFWWDSEFLRGMIWTVIPSFFIIWFIWFFDWIDTFPDPDPVLTQKLFVTHIPMFVLFIYFIIQLKHGKGTQWWILIITTTIWIIYLSIWAAIDPLSDFVNFYHGYTPYRFPFIIYVSLPGGIFSILLFYLLAKKDTEEENE